MNLPEVHPNRCFTLLEHVEASGGLLLSQLAYDALRENGATIIVTPMFRGPLVSSERLWLDISAVPPYSFPLQHELFTHLNLKIVDGGNEPSTKAWWQFRRLRGYLDYLLAKLRFGINDDLGNTDIAGRKKVGDR